MQWQVDGADRTTGEDKAYLIEADTEGEARAIAEFHGLYVSATVPYVDPDQVPPGAEQPAPDPAVAQPAHAMPPDVQERRQQARYAASPPAPAASDYQDPLPYARPGASAAAQTFADVPGAARRLRLADLVLSIFGWLYVAMGVIGGLLTLAAMFAGGGGFALLPLVSTLAALGFGVLLLGAGAAMRMLASIGIATTEIARRNG